MFDSEQKQNTTDTLFGKWELKEIRYDNGESLTPESDESYWLELKEDSVFAEQEYHYSLEGQSFCNPCFGYFDYNEEEQSINISFICERLICGIATEFASTVATSFRYSFQDEKLLLFFDSISQNKGRVVLVPK